jgi:hypothetical protein
MHLKLTKSENMTINMFSFRIKKTTNFYVYLGAACLPLNVVENQTTVGRLCRLELENAARHSWRTSVNSAIKEIRHSHISVVATHNNFVYHPPTQRRGPSGTGRKTGRRTQEFFSPLPGHRCNTSPEGTFHD